MLEVLIITDRNTNWFNINVLHDPTLTLLFLPSYVKIQWISSKSRLDQTKSNLALAHFHAHLTGHKWIWSSENRFGTVGQPWGDPWQHYTLTAPQLNREGHSFDLDASVRLLSHASCRCRYPCVMKSDWFGRFWCDLKWKRDSPLFIGNLSNVIKMCVVYHRAYYQGKFFPYRKEKRSTIWVTQMQTFPLM